MSAQVRGSSSGTGPAQVPVSGVRSDSWAVPSPANENPAPAAENRKYAATTKVPAHRHGPVLTGIRFSIMETVGSRPAGKPCCASTHDSAGSRFYASSLGGATYFARSDMRDCAFRDTHGREDSLKRHRRKRGGRTASGADAAGTLKKKACWCRP